MKKKEKKIIINNGKGEQNLNLYMMYNEITNLRNILLQDRHYSSTPFPPMGMNYYMGNPLPYPYNPQNHDYSYQQAPIPSQFVKPNPTALSNNDYNTFDDDLGLDYAEDIKVGDIIPVKYNNALIDCVVCEITDDYIEVISSYVIEQRKMNAEKYISTFAESDLCKYLNNEEFINKFNIPLYRYEDGIYIRIPEKKHISECGNSTPLKLRDRLGLQIYDNRKVLCTYWLEDTIGTDLLFMYCDGTETIFCGDPTNENGVRLRFRIRK